MDAILKTDKGALRKDVPYRIKQQNFFVANTLERERTLVTMVVTDEMNDAIITPSEAIPADPLKGFVPKPSALDIAEAEEKQAIEDSKKLVKLSKETLLSEDG